MPDPKIIDLDRLDRYDEKLKTQANILQRSTAYAVNEWVYRGNTYLMCTTAGTTASTALNLSGVSVGDTLTDGTVEWTVFYPFSGAGSNSGIVGWTASTLYTTGDIVLYNNQLYRCKINHTANSSNFYSDFSKWDYIDCKFVAGCWNSATGYKVGEVVLVGDDLYRCLVNHTSSYTFITDIDKWEKVNYCNISVWKPPADSNTLALLHFDEFPVGKNEYGGEFTTTSNSVLVDGKWGNALNLSLDFVLTSPTYSFTNGTEVYTIEFWFNISSSGGDKNYGFIQNLGTVLERYGTTNARIFGGKSYEITLSNVVGSYNHIAYVVSTTTCTVFFNGSQVSSFTRENSSDIYLRLKSETMVSGMADIDELRISNVARYTSDFTVQSAPFETPRFSSYKKDDLVVYNNIIYRALVDNNDATFDSTNWVQISSSSGGGGASISDWTSSTEYALGDLVIYSNTLYKCTTAHTSTSSFDDTKWQGISVDTGQVEIPDWGQSTVYALNQCVIYNGDLYRCTTAHTSTTTFDSTKWERILGGTSTALYTGTTWNNTSTSIVTQDVTDYDFIYVNYSLSDDGLTSDYDITRVFTPSDIGLIDLGVEIDTSNYVKLSMEKTSSTGFDIDFSEFSTLGYYKINKIVGFIGGGSASITYATQQEVEALF